jgi:cell division protein FtsB
MLKFLRKNILTVIAVLVLLAVGFKSWLTNQSLHNQIEDLQSDLRGTYTELATTRNEKRNLSDTVDRLSDENTNLNAMIADLQARPQDVKYIIRTETVLEPSEPVVVYTELPENYVHYLNKDIPVAEFNSFEGNYEFKTYGLSFRNTLVVGEKDTVALLQVASSADEIWHEVPISIDVVNTEEKFPNFDPEIAIGLGISSSTLSPAGVVALPLVHLTPGVDIAVPAIHIAETPAAALYLGSANIGAPLPLVDDLWLSAGPTLDTNLQVGVGLAIGSKL